MKNKKIEKIDIALFLIPLVIFGIILLIYYPGILSFDSYNQLSQITKGVYSNAHPFFHTFIEKICLKVANTPASIATFQIIVFSLLWTLICKYNRKSNTKRTRVLQILLTIVITLNPINSIMSITLWKDILYSYALLSLTLIIEIIIDHKYKVKIGLLSLFALNIVLISHIRHNGLSVLVGVTVIFTLILLIKDRKSWNFAKFLILLLVFNFALDIPAKIYKVDITGVVNSSSSVIDLKLVQTTGAFLVNNKFSEEELAKISKYVDVDLLKEKYNPYFMDPINKANINHEYMSKNKIEIIKLLSLKSIEYPKTFIDYEYRSSAVLFAPIRPTYTTGTIINTNIDAENKDPDINHINEGSRIYDSTNSFIYSIRNDVLLGNIFYNPGLYFWVGLVFVIIISRKINRGYYLLLIPNIMNLGGLLITIPVQDVRYTYASILIVYLFILIIIDKIHSKDYIKLLKNTEKVKIDKKNPKVLLVIPAYNEEDNIKKTVETIWNYNKNNNTSYDIVVINDGSKDHTEEILINNNINHIKLVHNLGIGGAVQTGYKYALENDYDIAIQYDGDGQHDVKYIKDIIKPIIDDNIDMVIGSRFIEGSKSEFKSSFARRVGIKLISQVMEYKSNKKIHDTTSGFRASNRKIIELFAREYPMEYPEPISTVNVIINGYKVTEVPVEMKAREAGVSSIHSWKDAYYMINVFLSILLIRKVK